MKNSIVKFKYCCSTVVVSILLFNAIAVSLGNQDGAFGPSDAVSTNQISCIEKPTDLAMDRDGNLYVIQSLGTIRVVRLDMTSGIASTYAGNGTDVSTGENLPAVEAGIGTPTAITFDREGNLYIGDIGGAIRRVDAKTNVITNFAGTRKSSNGGAGDKERASDAGFRSISDLAFDSRGNLFVLDGLDGRVLRIDAKTGITTTFAGDGNGVPGDGGQATQATLRFPTAFVIARNDDLFIADYEHHRIRHIDVRTGVITTVAGTGKESQGPITGRSDQVSLRFPRDIAIDSQGNLFVSGGWGPSILRIDAKTGMVSVFAGTEEEGFSGDNGLATKATIGGIAGMLVDERGNLYFSDYSNDRIRKVDSTSGFVTTVSFRW